MLIQTRPPFIDNAFNDYFCGLSGSGEGLEMAGFDLHSGVNHWDYALRMFEKNHPKSKPVLTDISKARPRSSVARASSGLPANAIPTQTPEGLRKSNNSSNCLQPAKKTQRFGAAV